MNRETINEEGLRVLPNGMRNIEGNITKINSPSLKERLKKLTEEVKPFLDKFNSENTGEAFIRLDFFYNESVIEDIFPKEDSLPYTKVNELI